MKCYIYVSRYSIVGTEHHLMLRHFGARSISFIQDYPTLPIHHSKLKVQHHFTQQAVYGKVCKKTKEEKKEERKLQAFSDV